MKLQTCRRRSEWELHHGKSSSVLCRQLSQCACA